MQNLDIIHCNILEEYYVMVNKHDFMWTVSTLTQEKLYPSEYVIYMDSKWWNNKC